VAKRPRCRAKCGSTSRTRRSSAGGQLVLELGHNSLARVRPLVDNERWTRVTVTNDLAGIPRVLAAEKL
jgi:hypothetical protein